MLRPSPNHGTQRLPNDDDDDDDSFLRYGHFVEYMNMHAIRSVGQCYVNIPSLSPRRSRSKAVANDYRHSTGVDFEP